jgi:hypothetical protein
MNAPFSRLVCVAVIAAGCTYYLFACSREKSHGVRLFADQEAEDAARRAGAAENRAPRQLIPDSEKQQLLRWANNGDWRAARDIYASMAVFGSWEPHTAADIEQWRARSDALKERFRSESKVEWDLAAHCVSNGEFGTAVSHYRAAEELASGLYSDGTAERIGLRLDFVYCLLALGRVGEALPLAEQANTWAAITVEIEGTTRTRANSLLAECRDYESSRK